MSDQAKTIQEVSEAVREMRQKSEKYGQDSAEAKAVASKVEAALQAFDVKNQEAAVELQKQKDAAHEMKGQIQTLEQMLARNSSTGSKNWRESAEYKAVQAYVQGHAFDQKSLRMDSSTEGGYLVPTEMASEILRNITEISPVRQLARVRSVNRQTLQVPKRTGIPTAAWEGELEANPSSQSAYGNETLTTHRLGVEIPVTLDLLGDAAFDMESEISADVAEAFMYAEGYAFVRGTGIKQPEGFATKASLTASPGVSSSATVTADKLLELTGKLKVGYNPVFGFNRTTLAAIRQLKGTSNDHYIWQPNLAPNAPATIGGTPYVLIQDMDDQGTNKYPVVYADFRQAYMITDRTGMAVVRDPFTRAKYAQVLLNFMKWTHGQVVKDEAIKLYKTT